MSRKKHVEQEVFVDEYDSDGGYENDSPPAPQKYKMPLSMVMLFIASLLVFLGSSGYLFYKFVIDPAIVESIMKEYQDEYVPGVPVQNSEPGYEPPRNPDGTLISFDEVRKRNPDIIGWIIVPNTKINYPVVQSKDNDYYLHHNIDRKQDANGTLFANCDNKFAFDFNTNKPAKTPVSLIFGHHMRSGAMFENLTYYDTYGKNKGLDFYRENSVITFNTIFDESQWIIFSLIKLNTQSKEDSGIPPFNFYESEFKDVDTHTEYDPVYHQSFIDELRNRSMIDTTKQITVTPDDELLILCTCSYEYADFRTLIVARKLKPGEEIDVSSVEKSVSPKLPSIWSFKQYPL